MTTKISIISKSCTTFTKHVLMSAVFSDTSTEALTPFLHLSAGSGTSSTRARDGRAADTRDAGFQTSVAVAAQQSRSKSCELNSMGHAPGASLQGGYPDCGGVAAAHYGGMGTPIDGWVIDNGMKQWRKRLRSCVAANGEHAELCCECRTIFAVNAEINCHINRCSALK